MITIITGTPGAGKTLYAVTKLIAPLVGSTIPHKVGSELQEIERKVYTNVKGLMLDHELIDESNTGGLRNWHEWAKPGSVIVFDEVQKVWEPRANGSKVPDDIKALETHRHMGVDFIFITQGLALTERNLCMLCNRHLHVRRVANMPFAVVYEWDHASKSLLFSKAIATQKWFYDRKGYKLYKSAEVHTKSPRRMPTVVFTGIVGAIALSFLVPYVHSRLAERFGWGDAPKVALEGKKAPTAPAIPAAAPAPTGAAPASAVVTGAVEKAQPLFLGCAATSTRCTCYDSAGVSTPKEVGFCEVKTGHGAPAPKSLDWLRIPEQERHHAALSAAERDESALTMMAARSQVGRTAKAGKLAPHAEAVPPSSKPL